MPHCSFSQPNKQDVPTQRLLLKLGSAYLNVAKQNQIDIDSGLLLAANRTHLNRMIVIGENFEDIINNPINNWAANEDIKPAKKLVLLSSGSNRTRLLNLIGFFYAFQPAARKNDLDSALLFLTKAKQEAETSGDTKSLSQSLSCMGKCYLERGDLKLAAITFTGAINQAIKSGDKQLEATALNYWGTYSPYQPNTILDRISQLIKANTLYEQLNDKENQVNMLSNIGYLSFAAGKIDESRQSFLRALSIEKDIKFPYTHYTLDLIAVTYQVINDHENELRYAMDEVKIAEATKDSMALAYIYARRSNADLLITGDNQVGLKQEGLEWAQKSLAEFKRLGGDPPMYLIAGYIAQTLMERGKEQEAILLIQDLLKKYPPVSPIDRQDAFITLGEAYGQKNFAMAEKYFIAAEKLQKETVPIRGNIGASLLYYKMGHFYFYAHQYETSRKYLSTALSYPNYNSTGFTIYVHDWLATIDSSSGNFKSALSHLRRYITLNDSARKIAGNKQVDELRIQYETAKKDNNIKLLNQQAALQNAQIKEDKFTRDVMIAGSVLLVLFLGLLYNRFRLKQKTNKRLESQQKEISEKNTSLQHLVEEKEWLLKEVHHRVKNNLHTVICLLESQAAYLENDALKAVENSQHRIYAMSLIHQKLYQSEDVKNIDMAVYLPEFIHYLDDSFGTNGRIRFQLNIESLKLGLSQAIPTALIINEAVTNSIKYAFPGNESGIIKISMHEIAGQIKLMIADNGIGINTLVINAPLDSLGLKLMKGLSEDINAAINFENDSGTRITLVFNLDPLDGNNYILDTIKEKEILV